MKPTAWAFIPIGVAQKRLYRSDQTNHPWGLWNPRYTFPPVVRQFTVAR
ncbi:hypothetical protein DESHY_70006 [Desulforamulus hydrothermalis Lam5 = DSM 18033]|uniref:Uncharacterized protein n=1 Tax=Desulforamulus hydrothermalis Lam5 = DSM 18033 TaxID=1121428 RepID=K8E0W7_9FIRM|nr:hypothetical protein DESHY_70006 [Desulforamulus hydrothermalis Lam5 = DSM 18033]